MSIPVDCHTALRSQPHPDQAPFCSSSPGLSLALSFSGVTFRCHCFSLTPCSHCPAPLFPQVVTGLNWPWVPLASTPGRCLVLSGHKEPRN